MIFEETALKEVFLIHVNKVEDQRGYFARIWCKGEFAINGLSAELVQSNIAFNKVKGTLRGLHYQVAPHEETKLIRCTRGAIYDVIVDLRPQSLTYKKWFGVELSEDNNTMLYIPEGFAHGYLTLKDNTEVNYKVSRWYVPRSERGIRWDDPSLKITWPEVGEILVSEKDQAWPLLPCTAMPHAHSST